MLPQNDSLEISFSIFSFLSIVTIPRSKWSNPWSSSHTHTHSALSFLSRGSVDLHSQFATHSRVCAQAEFCAVSQDPTQQPGNDTSNPAHTVRSSSLKGRSSEPCNVPPTRHPDPTHHSHMFVITGVPFWLLTNAIVTHKHTSEHSGLIARGGRSSNKACRTESEYT